MCVFTNLNWFGLSQMFRMQKIYRFNFIKLEYHYTHFSDSEWNKT